jgi:MFS transporter, FSR family, fosmidomycin resistance protein
MVADTSKRVHTGAAAAGELQTLVVVSSAHFVSHLHIMVLPVLLPLLKERLEVGFFELALALTAFNVVSGLTQAPMGFLVDRIGARRVLIAGLALGGLAFVSLGVLSFYAWLMVAALLAGLANCVYHPAGYAILSERISEGRIGRAFSVHTFAGFAGSAIAPPLLLGLAAAGGLGSALAGAGIFAWIVAAVVFLTPAAPRARQSSGSAVPTKVNGAGVFTPTVVALTVFFTLLALASSAMYSFSVVALISGHGLSLAAANAALTTYLVGAAAGVLAGGPLADKTVRHGDLAAAGFGLAALITLGVALLSVPVPVLVVAMGLVGLLVGMVQPARDMLVRKAAPPGAAGRVFGIVSTGFNIGGIVGPLLFGWLMDQGAPRAVFGVAVAFMVATALFAAVEDRRPLRRARSWRAE